MPLKITKSADPIRIDTITTVIYAAPGLGKTTVAFTAEKPLLLDFDGGVYRAGNRGDAVQVSRWSDVARITADDLADYKTLIVDTAGRALDLLSLDILANNEKAGKAGALNIQGFGILKRQFIGWLSLVKSFGLNIVLIAHMEEQKKGEETVERLDVQGGSKGEIYKSADAMGRLYLSGSKRMLNFSPSEVGHGKNPAQLDALVVPGYQQDPKFLAGVISTIIAKLNEQTEAQRLAATELAKWQERIDGCKDAAEFTALLPELAGLNGMKDNVRRMLDKATKAASITFDTKTKRFVDPKKAETETGTAEAA